ncbi:unnamed protein product, partial [Prunus brigantina]
ALYVQDLVHSKEVIILKSNVVVGVVYPINQLDFDDELNGLFKKFDVRNIDYINKCLKMHIWMQDVDRYKEDCYC